MILLDYPYVSDFLLDTIEEFGLPVVATDSAKKLAGNRRVNWIPEVAAVNELRTNPHPTLYTNSENSIAWIQQNAPESELADRIQIFKNKFEFRTLMQEIYPELFHLAVALEELKDIDPSQLSFPLVMKPSVGFFSLGVHRVNHLYGWQSAVQQIQEEMEQARSMYPREVIDSTQILLETYIPGEEYAFDCYFDGAGNPVLLNVLKHTFSSEQDVGDRIYSSSPALIIGMHKPILDFLHLLGSKVELRNFPLPIEIRRDKGKIYPIEVNPMRFGGFCTTADLTWFSYGINSYLHFLRGLKPVWEDILPPISDKIFSLILLDNQAKINPEDLCHFDYDGLLADFEKPLHLRKTELDKFGVFGFLFTETSLGNEKELNEILQSDLKKYIRLQ